MKSLPSDPGGVHSSPLRSRNARLCVERMIPSEVEWRIAQHEIERPCTRAAVCSHAVRKTQHLCANAQHRGIVVDIATEHERDPSAEAVELAVALREGSGERVCTCRGARHFFCSKCGHTIPWGCTLGGQGLRFFTIVWYRYRRGILP